MTVVLKQPGNKPGLHQQPICCLDIELEQSYC